MTDITRVSVTSTTEAALKKLKKAEIGVYDCKKDGARIFAVAAAVSNLFVFRITVGGSGSYLSPEVRRIIYECGVKEFNLYSGLDVPSATGKILALPQVTFCNIEKRGSILHIDVRVNEEHGATADRNSLVSDREYGKEGRYVNCRVHRRGRKDD